VQQQHLTSNQRQTFDEKQGWLGYLLLSVLSKRAEVSRQLLPVRVFHGSNNRKMNTTHGGGIRLIITEDCRARKTFHKGRLKKVVLAAQNVPLPAIIARLSEVYGDILAAQLLIGERSERWINPTVTETFSRMAEARACASQADGNDRAQRFWKKLEMLYQSDVGLPFDVLQGELKNFEKEIRLRV
jgi:hypothetical protein